MSISLYQLYRNSCPEIDNILKNFSKIENVFNYVKCNTIIQVNVIIDIDIIEIHSGFKGSQTNAFLYPI